MTPHAEPAVVGEPSLRVRLEERDGVPAPCRYEHATIGRNRDAVRVPLGGEPLHDALRGDIDHREGVEEILGDVQALAIPGYADAGRIGAARPVRLLARRAGSCRPASRDRRPSRIGRRRPGFRPRRTATARRARTRAQGTSPAAAPFARPGPVSAIDHLDALLAPAVEEHHYLSSARRERHGERHGPDGHEAATGSRWAPVGSRGWPSSSLAATRWSGRRLLAGHEAQGDGNTAEAESQAGHDAGEACGSVSRESPQVGLQTPARTLGTVGGRGLGPGTGGLGLGALLPTRPSPVARQYVQAKPSAAASYFRDADEPRLEALDRFHDRGPTREREPGARSRRAAYRARPGRRRRGVRARLPTRGWACLRALPADDRGCYARARELTQSVFIRAWDRLGSFRGDSQLSSWLHRIAVNEVLVEARTDRDGERG